jgi:adenylate cyclase
MKRFLLTFLLISVRFISLPAQDSVHIDSLQNQLDLHRANKAKSGKTAHNLNDSTEAILLSLLAESYWGNNPEQAMDYAQQSLSLSEKIKYPIGIAHAYLDMGGVYEDQGDYLNALHQYEKSLVLYKELENQEGISSAYNNIGNIYYSQGDYPLALENYFAAFKISELTDDQTGMAYNYTNIGNVYLAQGNYTEALKQQEHSLKILEALGDKYGIANSYSSIASIYQSQGNSSEALTYYSKALALNKKIGNKSRVASCLSGIAGIYFDEGNLDEAYVYYAEALAISDALGDKIGIASNTAMIGSIYTSWESYDTAYAYLNEALTVAKETKNLNRLHDTYLRLYELEAALGNYEEALKYHELLAATQDSITKYENTQQTVKQQMQHEFGKKEAIANAELEKQKWMRNLFIGGFAIVLIFAGIFFFQRNRVKKAKKESDNLLRNILPDEVAEELKKKGSADAKQFEQVTVMFTDFKGFTQISEKLSPGELVAEIHTCFMAFDNIMHKYNIEKIKTIGDSYMCAGGLPIVNSTHAEDVVRAALEIQHFMNQHMLERKEAKKDIFEIRIGIHTGTVVAGIVGLKKFAYDIWGDTVNTASRMESSGESGKVNISGSTYELVKQKFVCTHRGKIAAKNKGEIDMYFVESIRQ